MTLPRYLTTATGFSKILAAVLFISFPFAGFYLGYKYQQQFTKYLESRASVDQYILKNQPTATQSASTASPAPNGDRANWKTYRNEGFGFEMKYPPDVDFFKTKIKDFVFFDMRRTKDSEIITDMIELRIINLPFSAMTDEIASFGKCKSKIITQTGEAIIIVALNSVDYGHAGFGIGDMTNAKDSIRKLPECTDFNIYKDEITPLSVYYFLLSPGGQTYRFELGGGKNYVKEGSKEKFDQILSTFRFTN